MRDIAAGLRRWRLSYLLGVGEIRRRYARSRLGQFWVTLSTAFTLGALGLVWSTLWRMPMADLLPFIAASMIVWTFISGMLTEAPTVFVAAAPIVHNQGMELSTFLYALTLKHLLILAHNLPILVAIALFVGHAPGPGGVAALAGLALLALFMFSLGYLIAIACLRFRDLAQVVQNSTMILFFVTPVLWRPEQISAENAYLLAYNPFAIFLATIQKPLLGGAPSAYEWTTALALALGTTALALPIVGWARKRLIYWI